MRKQFTIFLILIFIFGLVPINFTLAITQYQIDSEVQIVCPDNYGNWFSGSGTIISSKGIILTNKHVVTDSNGQIIKFCLIGESIGINQYANFSKKYVAETKYYSTSNDLDAAILYVINNNDFDYFNIFESSNNDLKGGDSIEVIGYPGYNDLKLTQTDGQFVGFGSDDFKNYLEATTYINHGNSGGTAYNYNKFVGVPTFGVQTESKMKYYFLSIDSIKNWLKSTFGENYLTDILGYQPSITQPEINLPADHTGPAIKNAPRDVFWYKTFNDDGSVAEGIYVDNNNPWKDLYTSNSYKKIQITMRKDQFQWSMDDLDRESGIYSVLYSYSNNIHDVLNGVSEEKIINYISLPSVSVAELTPIITLPDVSDIYYINIRFKDKSGNVSNPYILTYVYEKDAFLELQNVKIYSDSNYKKMIGNYDFEMKSWDGYAYPQYHQYCVTNKKELYVKWQYKKNYTQYAVAHYNEDVGELSSAESIIKGRVIATSDNKYKITNLDKAKENNEYYGYNICENKNDTWCHITGKITSWLLKPHNINDSPSMEGKNTVIKLAYNPNYSQSIKCGKDDATLSKNSFGHLYIVLNDSKLLVEDSTSANAQTGDGNQKFSDKLKGKILLQVESHGEAYYVNSKDSKRYYMSNGNEAYRIMRYLGVGITDKDLSKVKSDKIFAKKNSGKIFLQVEAHGEAYYIDFNGNVYYLKDGSAAYAIMRDLGLGITNNDLSKISEGSL
ncbi:MAG: serine protease [bacterium]|nr:serine protease [bacterium]